MPHGLTRDGAGTIYYGEYPTGVPNPEDTVCIWRSEDAGRSWKVAHEFSAGAVRHVHAVQWDAIGGALWVATGDRDAHSRIGYSRDGGTTFTWVGSGSQTFRAVSFLFTPSAVLWAMDAPPVEKHVVRWDRASGAITRSTVVLPDPGYYAASLAGESGLVSLGETGASLWLVADGEPRLLHKWAVTPDPSRPHPVVRLLTSRAAAPVTDLYLNPLRTHEEAAAILRIDPRRLFAR
jgi:hypothetical protein